MNHIPEWAIKMGIDELPEGITANEDGSVTVVKRMATEEVKHIYGVSGNTPYREEEDQA